MKRRLGSARQTLVYYYCVQKTSHINSLSFDDLASKNHQYQPTAFETGDWELAFLSWKRWFSVTMWYFDVGIRLDEINAQKVQPSWQLSIC